MRLLLGPRPADHVSCNEDPIWTRALYSSRQRTRRAFGLSLFRSYTNDICRALFCCFVYYVFTSPFNDTELILCIFFSSSACATASTFLNRNNLFACAWSIPLISSYASRISFAKLIIYIVSRELNKYVPQLQGYQDCMRRVTVLISSLNEEDSRCTTTVLQRRPILKMTLADLTSSDEVASGCIKSDIIYKLT